MRKYCNGLPSHPLLLQHNTPHPGRSSVTIAGQTIRGHICISAGVDCSAHQNELCLKWWLTNLVSSQKYWNPLKSTPNPGKGPANDNRWVVVNDTQNHCTEHNDDPTIDWPVDIHDMDCGGAQGRQGVMALYSFLPFGYLVPCWRPCRAPVISIITATTTGA